MERPQPPAFETPRAPLPTRFEPQLATLTARPPEGDGWLHEVKYDGYRIGCRIDRGQVRLLSRRGLDWTRAFAAVAQAARGLRVEQALLDGEVAAVRPDGRTDFQALQNALSGANRPRLPVVYVVFDLLHLDGRDVGRLPLDERKRLLAALVPDAGGATLQRAQAWIGRGPALFSQACELGLEGIVSKRRDAAYRSGRSDTWRKAKCTRSDAFVIGGFTEPEGASSAAGFGALLVGCEEGDHLRFVGKVGSGFSDQTLRSLRARLDAERTELCPFDPRPPGRLGRHARWVKPLHRARVRFTEWTSDGILRHPSFLGLCDPPEPSDVLPSPAPGVRPGATSRARAVPREDDVLAPATGLTRRAIIAYYEQIAGWMLPHVAGRPLTVVRCKKDLASCTFMHHASNRWAPSDVPRVSIPERTKVGEYLVIERPEHLVALARAGVVELHTWNTRADAVERPDRLVFDLDPGPQVRWAETVAAARWLRDALKSLGLVSGVKTTGGRGLHVVVPLVPREDWSHCFAFARAFAALAAQERPLFTTALSRRGRQAQILIDYLRNNRTNTSVAAYSVRARPEATVSVPLTWAELTPRLDPLTLTLATVRRRMQRRGRDPWEDVRALHQELPLGSLGG